MAEKKDKCAHPGCECPAAKDSKYCSDYCENVGNRLSSPASVGTPSVQAAKRWGRGRNSQPSNFCDVDCDATTPGWHRIARVCRRWHRED